MRLMFGGLAALAFAGTAAAATPDFEHRIGAGNLVMATQDGAKYEQAYAPFVTTAIAACVPATGNAAGKFILVADITRAGILTNGEVRPATTLSQCFAKTFLAAHLPPPPLPSYAKINYPLVIELDLRP